jgi:hypothetical protein
MATVINGDFVCSNMSVEGGSCQLKGITEHGKNILREIYVHDGNETIYTNYTGNGKFKYRQGHSQLYTNPQVSGEFDNNDETVYLINIDESTISKWLETFILSHFNEKVNTVEYGSINLFYNE